MPRIAALFSVFLAIYFVPLFFVLVRRRFPLKERPQ
jgi:multidrug efflux pump